jgi:chemotaxis methyl-accepting protein methylase
MDLVMCRNALIYFGREQQTRIIDRLSEHLVPGGHLILSHTESLGGRHPKLQMLERSVFEYCPKGAPHVKHRRFSLPASSHSAQRKGTP